MDQLDPEYTTPYFTWDADKSSKIITIKEDKVTLLQEKGTNWKTVLGTHVFQPGHRYFFEIRLKQGNQIHIGVCPQDILITKAFTENQLGFGISLQNGKKFTGNSNRGSIYGKSFKINDILGIRVDLWNGRISFEHNGLDLGTAFQSEKLKDI